MRPPSRLLAPQGQNHQAAPPRPSRGCVTGPGDPPSSPPRQPMGRRRPAGETAAPHPPRGAAAAGGGTPQLRQAQPRAKRPRWTARTFPHYWLPTGNGTAAPRNAQTKRPTLVPAWERQESGPGRGDPPPPLATLTNRRPTGPRPAPTAARQPRLHMYTPGGAPETKGDRDAGHGPSHGAGGWGAAARPPLPPPSAPRSPPGLRAAGAPALRTARGHGIVPPPP